MNHELRITKMQGCGNDYVYINCFEEKVPDNPEQLAKKISDRHFGVGADGLILILPSQNADAFMQLYNFDGSEALMCGNGIRCVAKYLYDHGLIPKDRRETFIDTPAGVKKIFLEVKDERVVSATVNMGMAKITSDVPEKILIEGSELNFIGVDVGNPHAVYFLEDNLGLKNIFEWPDSKFAVDGKKFETHERFSPDRVNSEFIEIISRNEIKMRVFERGSGETMACGTGATAAAFAGFKAGKLDAKVLVHLRGGDLRIEIGDTAPSLSPPTPASKLASPRASGAAVCYMTGPAVEVFTGKIEL